MPGYFQNLCVYFCVRHSSVTSLISTLPFLYKLVLYMAWLYFALHFSVSWIGKNRGKVIPYTHRQRGYYKWSDMHNGWSIWKKKRRRQVEREHTHRDFYRYTLYLPFSPLEWVSCEKQVTWRNLLTIFS